MFKQVARRVLLPIVIMLTLVSMTFGTAPKASATTYVSATTRVCVSFAGNSYHPYSVRACSWNNGARAPGFCIDFGGTTPNHSAISFLGGSSLVPRMNAEQSAQAKYIVNQYAWSNNANDVADAALAIWRLTNNPQFNGWYSVASARGVISPWRQGQVNAILGDAAQHAPYKMSITASQVYPGQTGTGAVRVYASNGRQVTNRKVSLVVANAKVLSVNGVAAVGFTYQRLSTGTVGFRANLTTPSSYNAELSVSSSGHQRTLSGGFNDTVSATYYYDLQATMSTTSVCDTSCNGMSTVTTRACNGPGAYTYAPAQRTADGTQVIGFRVAPNTCNSQSVRLPDGTKLTSSYCYTATATGGCVTPVVNLPGVFEVVCPAWVQATITVSCSCNNATASVTFTAPAGSPRYYTGRIVISNSAGVLATKDYALVNGQPQVIAVPWTIAPGVAIEARFSAYRDATVSQTLVNDQSLVKVTVNSTATSGGLAFKAQKSSAASSLVVK